MSGVPLFLLFLYFYFSQAKAAGALILPTRVHPLSLKKSMSDATFAVIDRTLKPKFVIEKIFVGALTFVLRAGSFRSGRQLLICHISVPLSGGSVSRVSLDEYSVDQEARTDIFLTTAIKFGIRAAIRTPPTNPCGFPQISLAVRSTNWVGSSLNRVDMYLRDHRVTTDTTQSQESNCPAYGETLPLRSPISHSCAVDAWRTRYRPKTSHATARSNRAKSVCSTDGDGLLSAQNG